MVSSALTAVHPDYLAALEAYDFADACATTTSTAASLSCGSTVTKLPRRWYSTAPFFTARARKRGTAADWQLQAETSRRKVARQVVMAHLAHLGYLLADHRMICSGSNSSTAFEWRASAGACCPRLYQTDTTNMPMPSVTRPPGMAVREAPTGPPAEMRSLAASYCLWVVLRSKPDSMSAWHASSPLPRHNLRARQHIPAVQDLRWQVHCRCVSFPYCGDGSSAYRSLRLLCRSRTAAPLATCGGQGVAGRPFRSRSAWPATATTTAPRTCRA